AACAGVMQAQSGNLGSFPRTLEHPASRAQPPRATLLGVLPHLQHVFAPLEVHAGRRHPVRILYLWIEIHEVRVGAKRRRLDTKAHRRGITTLDFSLERRSESVEFIGKPGELRTTAV